ncbi:hypothetical protein HU200_057668 [Digitaria exilis]|uniref:Uncharacterized protein n=1 Tax=Digitaria exilis TaxID=1010633 RepID=A0A835AF43_9POAL|nr:hypothetical protein HU200_057668 [Digitaria exilis]
MGSTLLCAELFQKESTHSYLRESKGAYLHCQD